MKKNLFLIFVLVFLIILLAISGYFNYKYYVYYNKYKNIINSYTQAQTQLNNYISGNITEINSNDIKVKDASGQINQLKINSNTQFNKYSSDTIGSQIVSWSDFKAGDSVAVFYTEQNSSKIATIVQQASELVE